MTTPHIHAEVIKAWADGATIQYWDALDLVWADFQNSQPIWADYNIYRVKPIEPKKVKMWNVLYHKYNYYYISNTLYTSEEEAKNDWGDHFIKLLPHTEIEIEVTE